VQRNSKAHRLVVVQQQWRHRSTGLELISTVDAAIREHRISEPAKPIDVPPERADRDLKARSQLVTGPVPMIL